VEKFILQEVILMVVLGQMVLIFQTTITQIDFFKNIFIVDVVCGYYHCLSISNNGEIYSWGDNENGKLGNGKNENQLTPIKIFKI
jgi:alpha-tubulin suppressor-like RCC1 family protein